jgi:hypothetical protein
MKPGTVNRSPGIYLMGLGKPRKTHLGESDEGWATTFVSNGVPYVQLTLVGSHSTLRRKMEEKKEMIHIFWRYLNLVSMEP